MRPLLLSLHLGAREVTIHTYGTLIVVGLAVGIAMGAREARRLGLDVGRVLDFAFWGVVAGLLGSRVAYGLVNLGDFGRVCAGAGAAPRALLTVVSDCTRILHVWEGGLVFYGGIAGTALVAVFYARRERWSFWTLGDVFAPGLALGHAIGRVGCFAAGCCFGKSSTGAWGVAFPPQSLAFEELASLGLLAPGATATPRLHPTQLYEAAGEALICAVLLLARPSLRARPGALALLYGGLYAGLRFVVELFRGDVARRFVVEWNTPGLARVLGVSTAEPVLLSVGQLVSAALLGACVVGVVRRRRARTPPPPVLSTPAR
jgi:phosphatidylglycerol:prolipoprotein diacylglycerol transferase